jgi:DNA-binding transcriptional ArsR family regulator
MLDVEVIEDAGAAAIALDPIRSRILSELAQPASAAGLAVRLGLARQKVNYHLRELEKSGLVRIAEKRKWGGLTERFACRNGGNLCCFSGCHGTGSERSVSLYGPAFRYLFDCLRCTHRTRSHFSFTAFCRNRETTRHIIYGY